MSNQANAITSNYTGRWTQKENEIFAKAYRIYGKEWKKVQQLLPNRTTTQIRSHAQKYFLKNSKPTQIARPDAVFIRNPDIENFIEVLSNELTAMTMRSSLYYSNYSDCLDELQSKISKYCNGLPQEYKHMYMRSFESILCRAKFLREWYNNTLCTQTPSMPLLYIHETMLTYGYKSLSDIDFFRVYKQHSECTPRITHVNKDSSAFFYY